MYDDYQTDFKIVSVLSISDDTISIFGRQPQTEVGEFERKFDRPTLTLSALNFLRGGNLTFWRFCCENVSMRIIMGL